VDFLLKGKVLHYDKGDFFLHGEVNVLKDGAKKKNESLFKFE
jgi:hypothetical protein